MAEVVTFLPIISIPIGINLIPVTGPKGYWPMSAYGQSEHPSERLLL